MKPLNGNHDECKREIKTDKPFSWVSKAAMKTIGDIFASEKGIASARGVYLALSEIASDEGSERFVQTIKQVADRAAVSYRTAASVLNRFESINLIAIERHVIPGTKEHAPSTYTMLGNHCLTLGKQNQNCLPILRKKGKNSKKDDDTRAHARTRETVATQRANGKSSSSNLVSNLGEAMKHPLWPQFEAYCRSRPNGSPTLKGFNTWLPQQSANGAPETSKPIPIAQRNKIINRLNDRKARIIHTFPDGRYAQWAVEQLADIQRQLEKL